MRKYTIYIDENLPRQLARGLHILQQPMNGKDSMEINVVSIKEQFGEGAKDEDWIPVVGKEKGIVITQDFRIQTLKHQKELYNQHGVGMLFISPPSNKGFKYWDMVKLLTDRWDDIKKIIKQNKAPFAFRCTARKPFEKVD